MKVGAHANSQELARLTAADDAQENKLKALQAGTKFKAICDLAFSSGAEYMSFSRVCFKIDLPKISYNPDVLTARPLILGVTAAITDPTGQPNVTEDNYNRRQN